MERGSEIEFFIMPKDSGHKSIWANQKLACPYCNSLAVTAVKHSIGASYYKRDNCSNDFSVLS